MITDADISGHNNRHSTLLQQKKEQDVTLTNRSTEALPYTASNMAKRKRETMVLVLLCNGGKIHEYIT